MTEALTGIDLHAIIAEERSAADLRRYFAPYNEAGTFFTGSRFNGLSGGGDREAAADRIDADDLVAVEMLSVRVPGPAALGLLEGPCGRDVAQLLRQIPTDVMIGMPRAEPLLAADGPAELAWMKLLELDGVGWVTAGKLLARKRPHLAPVYDHVVACAIGRPFNAWAWFQDQFAADDRALSSALVGLRERAGIDRAISVLRVLDVVLWMRHRDTHTNRCARLEFKERDGQQRTVGD